MSTSAQTSSGTATSDKREHFHSETHYDEAFKRLLNRPDLCDVVLIAGNCGRRIHAHRLILIVSNDYFSALLSGSLRESKEREVTINEVDGEALDKLISFCYTGSVEFRVDKMCSLLSAANYLQFNKIFEPGCEFLLRHLEMSNCLEAAIFAQQLNLKAILCKAGMVISEHFEDIAKDPRIFLLNAEQIKQVIASDKLDVSSEEFVFHFLMKWIDYEPEDRRKHFAELLAQVRLSVVPPIVLNEIIQPHCDTPESQKLIAKALEHHQQEHIRCSNLPCYYQAKCDAKHMLAVYYTPLQPFQNNMKLKILDYNLESKVWTVWTTALERRRYSAAGLMDGHLFTVGGIFKGSCTDVKSLDLTTFEIRSVVPLKTGRMDHSVAVLNSFIYAIGGCDDKHQALNSVERWGPTNRTWRYIAPMQYARWGAGVAVLNNLLYVCGGFNTNVHIHSSMECYNPVDNTWKSLASLRVERVTHCLAAFNGFLFAIGGHTYSGVDMPIERYDPSSDKWTTISHSPQIAASCICASLGSDLFINNYSSYFTVKSEGSCDKMDLQKLLRPGHTSPEVCCSALVAIPFDFRPVGKPPQRCTEKRKGS